MKILLIADIHANWAALQAITEPHDICLCLGDLVDYGLQPRPCIDWVRKHAHHTVRGNHDHGVAHYIQVSGRAGFKYLTTVTRPITQELITADERRYLGRLPITRMVTLDATRFLLVHATPRDPLDEYHSPDTEFWRRRLQGVDADVVCIGHTHLAYALQIDKTLVVNPGSVGQPRDGDPRAAYAIIEDRHVQLRRVEYPVEVTVQNIQQSSLPEPAKDLLSQVLRTGAMPKTESSKQKQQP
jgi:putative phosphoesterase